MRYLQFLVVVLVMVSCSKEEKIDGSDAQTIGTEEFILKSVLNDPYSLKVDKSFYVKKESNGFSDTPAKLVLAGKDKTKSTSSFTINEVKVPQTKKGTFNQFISSSESENYIQELYTLNADGHEVSLKDITVKLDILLGPILTPGDFITWTSTGVEENPVALSIKQNSITLEGDVIQKPAFVYKLVHGNKLEVTAELLKDFSSDAEITISVGAANTLIERNTLFAMAALDHSRTLTIYK